MQTQKQFCEQFPKTANTHQDWNMFSQQVHWWFCRQSDEENLNLHRNITRPSKMFFSEYVVYSLAFKSSRSCLFWDADLSIGGQQQWNQCTELSSNRSRHPQILLLENSTELLSSRTQLRSLRLSLAVELEKTRTVVATSTSAPIDVPLQKAIILSPSCWNALCNTLQIILKRYQIHEQNHCNTEVRPFSAEMMPSSLCKIPADRLKDARCCCSIEM